MITRKQRLWGLFGALALTLLIVRWVDSGDAPPSESAERLAQAEPVRGATGARVEGTSASELKLDLLPRKPYPELRSDLFKGEAGGGPSAGDAMDPSESGEQGSRNGPPPPPPLPFAYMGKMLEDGETVVFLTRGDQNYVVRKGQTLEGKYRVDRIGAQTMVLTYLPGRVKQSLAIGSAP